MPALGYSLLDGGMLYGPAHKAAQRRPWLNPFERLAGLEDGKYTRAGSP